MSFQTCKNFVHLGNTNQDISDEIWELWPSTESKSASTIKAQKGSKDIGKIIHVTDSTGIV